MSVTRQEPAQGGQAAGREAAPAMPFDAFLKRLSVYARARNDAAWLEWYEEWLRNMPKDDGREDYLKRSKADYEARTGETVEARMDQMRKEVLDKIAAIDLDELIRANIAESRDERIRLSIEEATNKQIMVDNFKIFKREYIDMTIRQSC